MQPGRWQIFVLIFERPKNGDEDLEGFAIHEGFLPAITRSGGGIRDGVFQIIDIGGYPVFDRHWNKAGTSGFSVFYRSFSNAPVLHLPVCQHGYRDNW